jgi:hypothetical protein
MAAMVKTALAAICIFTLATTVYLSASLMVLRPPRAHHQQWTLIAAVILIQGALTLFAIRAGGAKGLRAAAAAGGVVIAALGASSVYSTVSGPHFEGYSLVLGSMLVIQGLLTLITFAGSSAGTAAPLRR